VKFLVDAQLPPVLVRWLQNAGHDAEHVQDIGLLTAPDSAIWSYALQVGAAILTKDEDFAARSMDAKRAPIVVWLRVGNSTNPALRSWIDPRLEGIVQLVAQGNRLIEVI